MLILAIDTSGKSGGVTLAEADEKSFRLIESAPIAGGLFSAQLIPTVAGLLDKHGVRAAGIDGFAAISGPGSFTGLRVGLSAIKGLAETLHKPIAVVSGLEALAAAADRNGQSASKEQSDGKGKIGAAIDAGRKEVFFGLYQSSNHAFEQLRDATPKLLREELLDQAAFLAALASEHPAVIITSDTAIAEIARQSQYKVQQVAWLGSEEAARLGAQKILRGETVSVEALDANYLRRSDAELFFKAGR